MALIFFRGGLPSLTTVLNLGLLIETVHDLHFCFSCLTGLAWQYTAETISIVVVELIMAMLVRKSVMTAGTALFVISIFPLSLVLVAVLEAIGFD